jgi:hypothetical protein
MLCLLCVRGTVDVPGLTVSALLPLPCQLQLLAGCRRTDWELFVGWSWKEHSPEQKRAQFSGGA